MLERLVIAEEASVDGLDVVPEEDVDVHQRVADHDDAEQLDQRSAQNRSRLRRMELIHSLTRLKNQG